MLIMMNFDVNIKHFRHKYLTLLINRAIIFSAVHRSGLAMCWWGCISSRSHPTGSAAARRRRPLRRPNYRRRSAMVVCQAITSCVNYAGVLGL